MRFDLNTFEFVPSARAPQALAVAGADGALSWQALAEAAAAWAARAREQGITADVPVVIYGHKQTAFFVAMVGALMLGAPFVPVDTIYPAERLRRIVEIVRAGAVYDAQADRFEAGAPQPRALDEKGLAYVIFTSGSTGDPKGVQIGRESVALLGAWMSGFGLGEAPVFMNQAPFSFDLSMYEVFGTLALGGTCVLTPASRSPRPPSGMRGWRPMASAAGCRRRRLPTSSWSTATSRRRCCPRSTAFCSAASR